MKLRQLATTAVLLVTAASVAAFAAPTNTMTTAPNPHNNGAVAVQANMPASNVDIAVNLKANTGSHVVAVTTGSQVVATVRDNTSAAKSEPNAKMNTGNEEANITAKNNTGITTNPTAIAKNTADELNGQPATRAGTNIDDAIAANSTTANYAAMHTDAFNATNNTANLNSYAPLRTDGTAANANANNFTLTNTAALHYSAYNAGTAHSLNTNTAPGVIPNAYAGALLKTVALSTSPGAHLVNATYKVNKAWTGTSAQIA